MSSDIRVTKQFEDAVFTLEGKRVTHIRVEFYVGDHGPFVERIPKEEFSAAERDRRLEAFAREVRTS